MTIYSKEEVAALETEIDFEIRKLEAIFEHFSWRIVKSVFFVVLALYAVPVSILLILSALGMI